MQWIAGVWLALKQCQGFLGGVDQGPGEREQLGASASREYQSSHRLFRRSQLRQLAAQITELDGLTSCELVETCLQCAQGLCVREDLGGLLERLVLVDWHECCRWPSVSRHDYVVASVGYVAENLSQVAPELADRDRLGHRS